MSLMQGMNVLQLVLLHLASYLCLHLFLGRIGHSMGNYNSAIWAKMQEIKKCAETLFFHIGWILAHGEIMLLYAEDLLAYIWRRHQIHPEGHRKLGNISETD